MKLSERECAIVRSAIPKHFGELTPLEEETLVAIAKSVLAEQEERDGRVTMDQLLSYFNVDAKGSDREWFVAARILAAAATLKQKADGEGWLSKDVDDFLGAVGKLVRQ